MKIMVSIFILLVLATLKVDTSSISNPYKFFPPEAVIDTKRLVSDLAYKTVEIPKTNYDVYYEFYKNKIPQEYLEVFLKATEDTIEYRHILYSMMLLESQHFTKFENHKNSNGTSDFGPLMLNSSNIKNEKFRRKYFPKEEFISSLTNSNIEDDYVIYTAACINLFKAHMSKWDLEDSLRSYNAGPRILKAERWTPRVGKSKAYARKVKFYLEETELLWKKHREEVENLDKVLYSIVIK